MNNTPSNHSDYLVTSSTAPLRKKSWLSWLNRNRKKEHSTVATPLTKDTTVLGILPPVIAEAVPLDVTTYSQLAAKNTDADGICVTEEPSVKEDASFVKLGQIVNTDKATSTTLLPTVAKESYRTASILASETIISDKTILITKSQSTTSDRLIPIPARYNIDEFSSTATTQALLDPSITANIKESVSQLALSRSWFQSLKGGLSRSSDCLAQGIVALLTKRYLDNEVVDKLEELLITADVGVTTAARLVAYLSRTRFNQEISSEEIRVILADEIGKILEPVAQPLVIDRVAKPYVILVVGTNGSGKTTTIGKMAHQFRSSGLHVSLAAGDTFRAAAAEQLKIWGERSGCHIIARATGTDAAGLVFDAMNESKTRKDDVLLIDTAGRLQNKAHLMAELGKIVRVLRKLESSTPHACLLVLDATIGQNAHSQVEIFCQITNVSGLVITKLDGTARGGVIVALAEKFSLPVHYVCVGENIKDIHVFSAYGFARGLLGVDVI